MRDESSPPAPLSFRAYPHDAQGMAMAIGARILNQLVVDTVGTAHAAATLSLLQIATARQWIHALLPAGPVQEAANAVLAVEGALAGLLQQQASDWGRRFGHKAFSFAY